ncbi:MAG: LOG family protein [Firmicutes bacterium]|nr:LOG family protein [Bacillota bacterium]
MRKIIAVIGDATIEEGGEKHQVAMALGKALVDAGYRVQTGGRTGVMTSALQGAKQSKKYREGDTIGITPFFDRAKVNPYADIVIATGLDFYRNNIVINADAVVAIGGGAGTLAEIAGAWHMLKLIISYKNIDGWSSRIADQAVDHRTRYPAIQNDRVYGITTAEEVIKLLDELLPQYNEPYQAIYVRP